MDPGGKQVIFARNRLADDARRWHRRQQEDRAGAEEELLNGSRLGQALEMRARGDFVTIIGGLPETETQFLDASAALRERRRQQEQERQQRELAQAQALAAEQRKRADDQAKANARQRLFTCAIIALAVIAVVGASFAWRAKKRATSASESAQKALTQSFVRAIGLDASTEVGLRPDERVALWELAVLDLANQPVREKVIDYWFQTEESIGRALNRQAQGLHTAVGLNLAVRKYSASKATEMVERQGINATHLGQTLAALAAQMEPKDVASVADHLAKVLGEFEKQEKVCMLRGLGPGAGRRWQRGWSARRSQASRQRVWPRRWRIREETDVYRPVELGRTRWRRWQPGWSPRRLHASWAVRLAYPLRMRRNPIPILSVGRRALSVGSPDGAQGRRSVADALCQGAGESAGNRCQRVSVGEALAALAARMEPKDAATSRHAVRNLGQGAGESQETNANPRLG